MSASFLYPGDKAKTEQFLPFDWDATELPEQNMSTVQFDSSLDFAVWDPLRGSLKKKVGRTRHKTPWETNSIFKRARDETDVSVASQDITEALVGDTIHISLEEANELELRRQKEKLLKKLRKSEATRKKLAKLAPPKPPKTPIPALGARELEMLQGYLQSPKAQVLGEVHKVQLSVEDLRRFIPQCWLNDSVIDAYLAHLTEGTKAFAFTTHFYTKLEEGGPQAVKRWSIKRKLKVLEKDHILIPVNRNNMHWCLGVIDNKHKSFSFYDSLNGSGEDVVKKLEEYMVFETDKLDPSKHDLNVNLFKSYKRFPQAECSQQDNGSDCGVFLCRNAHQITNGQPILGFDQTDIPTVRETMAYTLLKLAKGL